MEDAFKVKRDSVRITAITKPTNFTIQLMKYVEDYKQFKKEIQSFADAQSPLAYFSVRSFCLAYQTFENYWFRAMILDVDEDAETFFVSVVNVDDGTTFSIQDRKHLKISSINKIFTPHFGITCSLPISINPSKEADATKYLMEIMKSNRLSQYLLHEQGFNRKVKFIELFDDERNITDELVQRGLAKRLSMAPTQLSQCFINNYRSLTAFSVHLERDTDAFKAITNYCGKYSKRQIESAKDNKIAMGVYKEDKCWYRVKILSKELNGWKVDFIDHGHSEVVEDLGEIDDPNILNLQPIAIRCSLVVENIPKDSWNDIEEIFKALSLNGKKIKVKMIKPGEVCALVEIKDDDSRLLDEILKTGPANDEVAEKVDKVYTCSDSDDGF